MTWKEIKLWAEKHSYEVSKTQDENNQRVYFWNKGSDNQSADSTSSLIRSIFNHMTDNKFLDHQSSYKIDEFQF
jgi:hypothetical protein